MLSFPHLVVLFVIALIIFGPQKLPELARMLGKATAEFRKMTNDFRYALEDEVRELDRRNRIKEEESAAAARLAAQPPAPAPSPSETPEGSVPRAIPETTVTATVEPAGSEAPAPPTEAAGSANGAGHASPENSASPHAESGVVSVPHEKSPQEKPTDDNAA
jgi:sec-independent protein translocase protein TatB